MKKFLSVILIVLLALGLFACSGEKQELNENLLQNGTFEGDAGTSGWVLDRYYTSDSTELCRVEAASDAPEGTNVLVLNSKTANDNRWVQTVTVEKNSYYCFSAWVKTGELTPDSSLTGANLSVLNSFSALTEFIPSNSDWQKVSLYLSSGDKREEITLCLRLGFYSADCAGTVFFDDVIFKKVEKEAIGKTELIQPISADAFASAKQEKTPADIYLSVILRGILYCALLVGLYFVLKNYDFKKNKSFLLFLGIALLLRLIISPMYVGFKVDINCFAAWGARVASVGIDEFYSSTYFCDYPPLYMMVCGLLSKLASLFDLSLTSGAGLAILKFPAALCDILGAYLIYKIISEFTTSKKAHLFAILYAFNPAAILNASVWGQVDSVLVVFMLWAFYLILKDRFGLSVLVFFAGLLTKPQAVLFGPVMLFAAAGEFYKIFVTDKKNALKRLLLGFGSVAACVGIFFGLSAWLKNGQEITWLFDKYLSTIGSYNYATLNSFGFMGLIGGQWQPAGNASIFGISYSLLGNILCILSVGYCIFLFITAFKKKSWQKSLIPLAALLLAALVTFSTRTHERYIFPVIALLLIAGETYSDKRFSFLALGYTLLNFINTATVLYVYEDLGKYLEKDDLLFIIGSLLTVVLFVLCAILIYQNIFEKVAPQITSAPAQTKTNKVYVSPKKAPDKKLLTLLASRTDKLPRICLKDVLICGGITVIYAIVAFTNLGDTVAPQTYWQSETSTYYATIDLGSEQQIDKILYSPASTSGSFDIEYSLDGESYSRFTTVHLSGLNVNSWVSASKNTFTARFVRLIPQTAPLKINEIAFFSGENQVLPAAVDQNVSFIDASCGKAENLFDLGAVSAKPQSVSIPQTRWEEEGEVTVYFDSIKAIDAFYLYSCALGESSVTFAAASDDGTTFADVAYTAPSSEYSWLKVNCFDLLPVSTNAIKITTLGDFSIAEIAFTDASGNIITPSRIEHSKTSALAFDEPQCFSDYLTNKTQFSQSKAWEITTRGDYVVADFGEVQKIQRGLYYASVCEGKFSVYYSYDGTSWSSAEAHDHKQGMLYYWHGLPHDNGSYSSLSARFVAVVTADENMRLIEMGFFASADAEETIPIKAVYSSNSSEHPGSALFDEQDLVVQKATYKNSMYFDEIYHARTAFESNNGLSIYEWTHPPLGKDMISWCISLMGMTPFAWRFAGTLAGVLMIPAIYALALLLFKKRLWASLAAGLMALDGMHFVQTRIATIDSFGVLFIICMFLFMYWYQSISFYNKKLWQTFIPLGLCGLSFGLGFASKWIGAYAGAGLALIFFITLYRRFDEYCTAKKALKTATGEDKKYLQHVVDSFTLNTCYTILFCLVAFIIVPLIIYCLSYYPYWNAETETRPWYQIIISNQKAMYKYHSELEATHPFQSPWYSWPVIYKPIWFYAGSQVEAGKIATISSFGNPAVWYAGLICTLFSIGIFIKRLVAHKKLETTKYSGFFSIFGSGDENFANKTKLDRELVIFLLIGIACNLLPWVGISRCIFIYHYFASVPFIILFTVYALRELARKDKVASCILVSLLLVAAIILFIMFKPLWTGTPVSKEFVNDYLRWFPSWIFGS